MKNKLFKIFPYVFLGIVIFIIYRNWFMTHEIIGGDWPFFYQDAINNFTLLPPAWSSIHANGLGGQIVAYSLDSYLYFVGSVFSHTMHIPWVVVYKFFWFGLFLLLSVFSSIFLLRTVLITRKVWQEVLAAILYTTNTYILLVVSGGQMGIALAYSFAPLVLGSFIKLIIFLEISSQKIKISNKKIKLLHKSLIAGFILALQVMFDIRIAYITVLGVVLSLVVYQIKNIGHALSSLLYVLLIPLVLTLFLHAFWLLPLFLFRSNPIEQLGVAYNSIDSVKFFSFAKFENTISLLHPFWPENIFGKVSFMKAEFLLLPIMVYGSLFFIANQKTKKAKPFKSEILLSLVLLGLLGVFLAKGASEPFGELYLWMFNHIPGFMMFRDPTKFYILIVLAYSILIPFSIASLIEYLHLRFKKRRILSPLIIIFVFFYFLFLIQPALVGQLKGTFQRHDVPNEYNDLKKMLQKDPQFYRILWLPRQHRFTFASSVHPSIEALPLLSATDEASLVKKMQGRNTNKYLDDLAIKYFIIPYDSYGEIFIDDRKYSQKKRDTLEKNLDKISWLKKIQTGKMTIYQNNNYKEHFYFENDDKKLTYTSVSSTHYKLLIDIEKPTTIIFSENYNPYWKARFDGKEVISRKTNTGLNSFYLPKGSKEVEVYYQGEIFYKYGLSISLLSGLLFLAISLYNVRKI